MPRGMTIQPLRLLSTFICLALLISRAHSFDYCQLNCHGNAHTMCLYPTEKLGPACVDYDKEHSVLTQEVKDLILDQHNKYRSGVAMGKETRGFPGAQLPAADMMEMEWDTELELIAQRYARQCTFEHDKCRSLSSGEYGGQNIAIKAGNLDDPLSHMEGFYVEVKDFNRNKVHKFQPSNGPMVGHYTQLVWGKSNKVGCGLVRFMYPAFQQAGLAEMLVCNYAPAGNFIGRPIYTFGKACSKCPSGTSCSNKYPGLCAGASAHSSVAKSGPSKQHEETGGKDQQKNMGHKQRTANKKTKSSGSNHLLPYHTETIALLICISLKLM